MTIECAANGIGDGIVVVIAIHEDGKDPCNEAFALSTWPGALKKLGQIGKYAGWIAACYRSLASRKGHIAAGVGITGDRIHDQQDIFAEVAEILRDAHPRARRQAPHHRAFVTGCND